LPEWIGRLRNIFFVGLMGAGKTTVGRYLAKNLGLDFYDTDQEIEKRTGVRVPTIFEMEGEAGFRKREVSMIDELTQLPNIVLATGGGAVLSADNRQHLASRGHVIYLRASVQDLFLRTRLTVIGHYYRTIIQRPSLNNFLRSEIPYILKWQNILWIPVISL